MIIINDFSAFMHAYFFIMNYLWNMRIYKYFFLFIIILYIQILSGIQVHGDDIKKLFHSRGRWYEKSNFLRWNIYIFKLIFIFFKVGKYTINYLLIFDRFDVRMYHKIKEILTFLWLLHLMKVDITLFNNYT